MGAASYLAAPRGARRYRMTSIARDYWASRFSDPEGVKHHADQNQTIAKDFLAWARIRKPFATALSADSVLEIGCGTGDLAWQIDRVYSPRVLRATDLSPEAVKAARERYPSLLFAEFDILTDWPSVYSGFSTVVASNVLEHFKNPWLVLDRMLEIGEQALVLVPYRQPLSDAYDAEGGAGHVRSLSRASFANYRLVDSFTFKTRGWQHSVNGEEPLQLAALLEAKR